MSQRSLRKIIVYIASSADGYIARSDGNVDWLNRARTAGHYGMARFYRSIDTILWGRKTYELALGFQRKGIQGAAFDPTVKNYIFSRHPPQSPAPAVEFVTEPIAAFASRLRSTPGKDIWIMAGRGSSDRSWMRVKSTSSSSTLSRPSLAKAFRSLRRTIEQFNWRCGRLGVIQTGSFVSTIPWSGGDHRAKVFETHGLTRGYSQRRESRHAIRRRWNVSRSETMFRSFWILVVCGVLMSCVTSQPAMETAEIEVQQASDRFWTTRERGDASSIAAQVTEEAILMVPGLPDAVGRSAVRDLLQERFASARTTDFKVHRREIQVIGDSAYELAWYSETYHGQEESLRLEGRYLMVWKRGRDDLWRVHRNLFNFSAAKPVDAPSN